MSGPLEGEMCAINGKVVGVVFPVAVLVLLLLILSVAVPMPVTGFHIEPVEGGNCVVGEQLMRGDAKLFCSADIHQVEDALRRYRSMPLGCSIRH